jgi:hypothetical protein
VHTTRYPALGTERDSPVDAPSALVAGDGVPGRSAPARRGLWFVALLLAFRRIVCGIPFTTTRFAVDRLAPSASAPVALVQTTSMRSDGLGSACWRSTHPGRPFRQIRRPPTGRLAADQAAVGREKEVIEGDTLVVEPAAVAVTSRHPDGEQEDAEGAGRKERYCSEDEGFDTSESEHSRSSKSGARVQPTKTIRTRTTSATATIWRNLQARCGPRRQGQTGFDRGWGRAEISWPTSASVRFHPRHANWPRKGRATGLRSGPGGPLGAA